MRQDILKLAKIKLEELLKKYPGFINIIVDDWRGFRFVYDTKDVRRCKNNCSQCPLYQLLKNEPEGLFSAGLYRASSEDRQLFGPQNYLNCKTLKQYQSCFVNFLLKKAKTPQEVKEELDLIKNLKIIYSTEGNIKKNERDFKQEIYREILTRENKQLVKITKDYLVNYL